MRLLNGANPAAPSIGARRGIRRKASSSIQTMMLDQRSIIILLALCATIFVTGLVVGTRMFGTPRIDGVDGHVVAEISPLAAATANMKPNLQRLILESAKAEVEERKESAAAHHHLRRELDPGDANYNPHRHVDDAFVDGGGGGGEGDGGMYAGDLGDHGRGEGGGKVKADVGDGKNDKDNMRQHFLDAVKSEIRHDGQRIVEGMHNLKERARGVAEDVIKKKLKRHGLLRGGGGREGRGEKENNNNNDDHVGRRRRDGVGTGVDVKSEQHAARYYPYMTIAVKEDYNFQQYEPLGGGRFVEYKDGDSPYDITNKIIEQSDELARSRRHHVLGAMRHVWKNYGERAFGKDEIKPISGDTTNRWGGMGTSLVDSLDTLWLMGMKDEFWHARDWVRDHLSFDGVSGEDEVHGVSFFETTIRSLGGLLAAYDLSRDEAFLKKADDLGYRLAKAYDTPSGLPHSSINIVDGRTNEDIGCLADVGTEQVEFRYLARATGKRDYADRTERAFDQLRKMQPKDGLLFQDVKDGNGNPFFSGDKVSFGAMGDSTYEYMLKIWIQGGRKEDKYREMWDKAMSGMHEQLLQKSNPNGLAYIADRYSNRLDRKMDHLVCFMGGSLALSAYTDPLGLDSPRAQRDLKAAKAIAYTCYQMYARTKSGLAPEFYQFEGDNDMVVARNAPFYILRPEAVEAFYYLSKLTGDPIYREWGWEIFQSIEKYCKTKYGYASLRNVDDPRSTDDRMESFFMAETLKYLYLLFDPDSEIDILNKHVFNTEAHPLSIFKD